MVIAASKIKYLLMGHEPKATSDTQVPLTPEETLPVPDYSLEVGVVPGLTHTVAPGKNDWYPGPMIGARALAGAIIEKDATHVREALSLLETLAPDDYSEFMIGYYKDGLERFGDNWGYADIVTVLIGLSKVIKPRRYLEVGVRRGRSVCAVAAKTPECDIVMFDMWQDNYASMENPGPDLVTAELAKVGHKGKSEFINGDSHVTLPEFFRHNPESSFDIITVDGDHTNQGAARDLADVLPHLAIGGAIVFDDVCHPKLLGLHDVWQRMVASDRRFSTTLYNDVGFGVGFAIRKY